MSAGKAAQGAVDKAADWYKTTALGDNLFGHVQAGFVKGLSSMATGTVQMVGGALQLVDDPDARHELAETASYVAQHPGAVASGIADTVVTAFRDDPGEAIGQAISYVVPVAPALKAAGGSIRAAGKTARAATSTARDAGAVTTGSTTTATSGTNTTTAATTAAGRAAETGGERVTSAPTPKVDPAPNPTLREGSKPAAPEASATPSTETPIVAAPNPPASDLTPPMPDATGRPGASRDPTAGALRVRVNEAPFTPRRPNVDAELFSNVADLVEHRFGAKKAPVREPDANNPDVPPHRRFKYVADDGTVITWGLGFTVRAADGTILGATKTPQLLTLEDLDKVIHAARATASKLGRVDPDVQAIATRTLGPDAKYVNTTRSGAQLEYKYGSSGVRVFVNNERVIVYGPSAEMLMCRGYTSSDELAQLLRVADRHASTPRRAASGVGDDLY